MKTKKILCAFLVLAMSMFVSCKSGSGDTAPTGSNDEVDSEVFEETKTEPSEFQPAADIDYGGYNFRILDYDGSVRYGWYASDVNEVSAEEENGDPINDAIYKRNKETEALYNINISVVPTSEFNPPAEAQAYRKYVLAGEDAFDAAFLPGVAIPTAIGQKNMACDLSAIISLDLSNSWWDQNSVKTMSIGGKLNAVVGDVNLYSAFATDAVYANKKLMQEYSIGNIYQIVKDGKWTWDAMYDIMRKVSKDLNGDGVFDQEDQLGLETQDIRLYFAVYNSGESLIQKNSEDIPELSPNIDRISSVVSKVASIFLDNTTTLMTQNIKGNFTNPYFEFILPKFINNELMFHINQLMFSFELRNMDADFAILPYPKYDENQNKYYSTMSHWWSRFTIVPTTCADTEKTGNILSAMGYYSQKYVMPAYYDVSITNKLIRDEDSLEMLNLILDNRTYDLAYIYDWGGTIGIFGNILYSGRADTFASEFEKKENVIAAAIQKTIEAFGEE
ncbi:MAG: extracellular solute-binding protein [Oscillospiraceae bacterium]|nr:extracellular solute-binding protein [Oscillospiraceae bacterium]